MAEIDWSDSRTDKMEKCGEAFRRRYVEGERAPSNLSMLRGKTVHKGGQFALQEKIDSGKMLPVDQAVERAGAYFDAEARKGLRYTADEKTIGMAESRGMTKDHALEMTRTYLEEIAPNLDPAGVEEKHVLDPSESLPVRFVGYIDVVEKDGTVRDTKTAAKKPSGEPARARQLGTYQLLRMALGKPMPKRVVDTVVRTAGGKLATYVSEAEPLDAVGLDRLVQRHRRAIDAHRSGVYVPAPDGAWWCSANFCEYADDCPFAPWRR